MEILLILWFMTKDKVEVEGITGPLERLTRLMRAGEHDGELNPAQWEALRYISRANRYSNSPGALTRFLGSTKGTVSQTIKALERKGLIGKVPRENERRSICLVLTGKGTALLANDPLAAFSEVIDELAGKTKRRLAKGLRELLAAEITRQKQATFGVCSTCRYYREKGHEIDLGGPHACMKFEAALSNADAALICVEHS
jgi:DNA-binding MarR family transcriptional regulator